MLIAGVDEVGRGPLAGPVLAAAVILKAPIAGLKDSKKLTEKNRQRLYHIIQQEAHCWAIGMASVAEIDRLNIWHASLLAMKRALLNLTITPHQVLVDGTAYPDLPLKMQAIVKGDDLIPVISAASIMAKVTRDALMQQMDSQYPQFGFAKHKGYGTPEHLRAIKRWGITEIHRMSFAPVKAASK